MLQVQHHQLRRAATHQFKTRRATLQRVCNMNLLCFRRPASENMYLNQQLVSRVKDSMTNHVMKTQRRVIENCKSTSTISLQTLTFSISAFLRGQVLLRVGECPKGGAGAAGQVENFGYQFMGELGNSIPLNIFLLLVNFSYKFFFCLA